MSYQPPQYPPGQYPPEQYAAVPGQPVQRRRGCRGCVFGCLAAFVVLCVVAVVLVAGGIYAVRQMYPTAGTVREAAGCVVMRVFANNLESALAQSELSEAEKEGMRRELQQVMREFEGQCGPLR